MTSKAITDKEDNRSQWPPSIPEQAPSVMLADVAGGPRIVGLVGVALLVLGATAILFDLSGSQRFIGLGLGSVLALFGIGGMLFHAAWEPDTQLRRLHGFFAVALAALALVAAFYPAVDGTGAAFLPWGPTALIIALLFFLPSIRGETEKSWRSAAILLVGALGAAAAGTGLIWGTISYNFLLPTGLILALIGLAYLWAFVTLHGVASDTGYRAGQVIGVAGLVVMIVALVRSLATRYGWFGVTRDLAYLTSVGFLLIAVGLLYVQLAVAICSDRPTVVLFRRELAAFFYSPLAYFLLFGFAVMAFLDYWMFVSNAIDASRANQPMVEPIVWPYIWGLIPVIFFILTVPLLTMRLVSEEERSGTLEMLLTAPLDEVPVVMSKFWAAMVVFLLSWSPYYIYLLALRLGSVQPFDYRPLISFTIALICSGAGVISMGLFFSSLTRNQVAAGVITAMGMMILTGVYFIKSFLSATSSWTTVLTYFSYIDLWRNTLQGKLALADLVFHVGVTIFWLFLTVKVLESRKWR